MRDCSYRGVLATAPPACFCSARIAQAIALLLVTAAAWLAPDAGAQPVVGHTAAESSPPAWPAPVAAPSGAPNVLLIMTDDVGFGASSTFGGPVPTPTFERLAEQGLRYNRFHTTALCSPTRQALLTGRNHHAVGMGGITEIATSAPGYNSLRPNTAAPLAETLKLNGYSTGQFGKCH